MFTTVRVSALCSIDLVSRKIDTGAQVNKASRRRPHRFGCKHNFSDCCNYKDVLKKMLRQALLVGVLAVLVFGAFHLYLSMGLHLQYIKHHPGDCRQVKGVEWGAEDFEVTEDGLAFITSGVNFPPMAPAYHDFIKQNNIRGRILLFDFKHPELEARTLKIRPSTTFDPDTFQPHGISLLEDKVKGEHILYVINHPKGGKDRVEKFRFLPKVNELEHLRFLNSSLFTTMNDLAVVSEDKFYISEYLSFENHYLAALETMLALPFVGVFYVDGNDVTEVVSGLQGGNGITLSKDKKYVYLSLPHVNTLHVYERQKDNGLKLIQDAKEVGRSIDNMQLTFDGDALLGGVHPILYKTATLLTVDPSAQAPSAVIRMPLKNGHVVTEDITELFYDHGDLISASTVAQIHSNQLLIGSIIDKLVVCDLYTRPLPQKARKS